MEKKTAEMDTDMTDSPASVPQPTPGILPTPSDAPIAALPAPPAGTPGAAASQSTSAATPAAIAPTMDLDNNAPRTGEGAADDRQDGHTGRSVEDRTQGTGYAKRGGHQDTKQGRKDRKKGKKEMGRTAFR